ncbi:VWFA and cache domain-containing protein 1-like [Diadema antillarum]|uniref:VWFA and cache domain-containing protein 1-like n=1 Tax=Diadema antillarum TaxID=105358 RepID=UPI003A87D2E1
MASGTTGRKLVVFAASALWLLLIFSRIEAEKTNQSTEPQQTGPEGPEKEDTANSKKKLPEFPNGVIKFNNPDLLKGLTGNARPPAANKRQSYAVVEAEFRSGVTTSLISEAQTLAKKFSQIVEEELGYTSMQKIYDAQNYQRADQTSSDEYQVQRIASKVRAKLRKFQNVLNTNRRTVESLYRQHRSTPISNSVDCCTLARTKHRYDSLFGTNISRDTSCEISSLSTPPSAFIPTKNITQAFKRQLLSNPTLKWQYFSSEDGVHAIYPATPFVAQHKFADACTVDIRTKSLYASTVRPTATNVVIIIDRGSSISPVSLEIAQKAAKIALGALSRKDKVAVLSMGSDVHVSQPGSCYDNSLAPASAKVKEHLITFINGIKAIDGPSNHTAALGIAFELIQRSTSPQQSNGSTPDSVILYISTGHASNQQEVRSVINLAISENRRLNNRVVIMTYPLVEQGRTELEELSFLRDLAEQDNGTYRAAAAGPQQAPVPMGVMTVLNPISHIPSTMGTFYTVLPRQPSQAPVSFSLPYMDSTGTGLIMSLTRPCYANDQVFGIVGLDINMADILEDVTYFEEGDQSYAFMIDDQGLTIMHPSLPKPSLVVEQPIFTSIRHFEQSVGFDKLQEIVLREKSGSDVLRVSMNETIEARYSWKHVDGTPFTVVAVVLTEIKDILNLRHTKVSSGESLMYHRLDLLPSSVMCMHLKQLATLDGSSLLLSASSFASPYEHLSQEETKLVVQAYMAYLSDNTRLIANPGLKSTIKNDVAVTRQIEKTWMKQILNSDNTEYIVRRYVATTSGAVWMYPGTLMSKTFDPARRPWYKRALDNPGKITLSSPYLDAGGAGYIVTLSRVIFEGRSNGYHTETDHVVAVMGIDITLPYFYQLLTDTLPVCTEKHIRCFVMDERGYLVAHPYFVEPLGRGPMEKQHITHQEILISNDVLYHDEFVQKLRCNRFGNRTVQRYYSFNTSYQGVVANKFHSEHCIQYKMMPIPFSNTFVGVVNETCEFITAFCPCSMTDRLCLNCHRMEQEECECPCECGLELDPCTGDIMNLDDDGNPSCPGMEEDTSLPAVDESIVADLPQCYDFQCDQRATMGTCRGVLDCEWCEYNQDGSTLLKDPYCATQRECFGGVLGAPTPYQDQIVVAHRSFIFETDANAHVGPVAGALLGVILSLALVIYIYRHHVHNQERRRREMAQNGSDTSVRMTQGDADAADATDPGGAGSNSPDNQPPPGAYGQGNVILAALHHPSPYHQRIRHGIRIWRRHGQAPSESDHGYSTMTPHEDSEYQYVEPEPVVASPERNIVDPPPGMLHVDGPMELPTVTCRTALITRGSSPPSCDNPLAPSIVPKIDPPPQTVLPRRSHHMRTRAQVHSVDTTC